MARVQLTTNCEKDSISTVKVLKPLIKWVGGKTQILDKVLEQFPREMENYHEIFLGGGSVLLGLLSNVKNKIIKVNKNIYAYDLNEPLISVYKNIQTNHQMVYTEIRKIIEEFYTCGNNKVVC